MLSKNRELGFQGGRATLPPKLGGRVELPPTVLSADVAVYTPEAELILQVCDDVDITQEMERWTSVLYGGGRLRAVVDTLYVVCGNTVVVGGEESLVREILQRYRVGNVGIACVKVEKLKSHVIVECYVVPFGQTVIDYRPSDLGKLVRSDGEECIATPAIRTFCLDPEHPVNTGGILGFVRYKMNVMALTFRRGFCCASRTTGVVRISMQVYEYLASERLGTIASLRSDAAARILLSSALREFDDRISDDTIRTTVQYFACKYSSPIAYGAVEETAMFERKTTLPDIFDTQAAVVMTGGGVLLSEEDSSSVNVVDNGLLTLKAYEGVTFDEGVLTFNTPCERPTPIYHIGAAVASAAVKNSTHSTHNKSCALKRMTNSREDEATYRMNADLTLYALMANRGGNALRVRPGLLPVYRRYSVDFGAFDKWGVPFASLERRHFALPQHRQDRLRLVLDDFEEILGQFVLHSDPADLAFCNALPTIEQMYIMAQEPHIKYDERMVTMAKITENARLIHPSTWPAFVDGKVKWETGKYNKLARQYVSLHNACALEWMKMPQAAKQALAHTFTIRNDFVVEFVPDPSQSTMDRFATALGSVEHPHIHTTMAWYHSDDSIFTARVLVNGEYVRIVCCIDISKCDLSHSPALFAFLAGFLQMAGFDGEKLHSLFMQLRKDIRIVHPDRRVNEFAVFQSLCMVLFSGSVLTTLVNNFASLIILLYTIEGLLSSHTPFSSVDEVKSSIINLACEVGYEVSLDAFVVVNTDYYQRTSASNLELSKTTFLKHYPVRALDGSWIATKDIATLVRGIGFSDEPADGLTRMREIFQGMNCSHRCELYDFIFESLDIPWPPDEPGVVERKTFSDEALVVRYGVSFVTLREAFELLFAMKNKPCFVVHPGFDAILRVGYSLPRLYEEDPRPP